MKPTASLQSAAIKRSLQNLFIADALAMPVHWFYRPADILSIFPPHGITRMEPAPHPHPSSIMQLHSTRSGGRKSAHNVREGVVPRDIVGDVILVGKRSYWDQPGTHYHHGMPAGENTLNAWCTRLMIDYLSAHHYSTDGWLSTYIGFMTATEPQHPDTYAESYHRVFFANLERGLPPHQCGAVTHDTPSMGALVTVAPLAFAQLAQGTLEQAIEQCQQHVWLTHPATELMPVVAAYVTLLHKLLLRNPSDPVPREWFIDAAKAVPGGKIERFLSDKPVADHRVVGQTYSLACYITDSWPSVCYLAARYCDDPATGLLRNANLGGENAHRGAVLGTLLGLCTDTPLTDLYNQLRHASTLDTMITRFHDALTE